MIACPLAITQRIISIPVLVYAMLIPRTYLNLVFVTLGGYVSIPHRCVSDAVISKDEAALHSSHLNPNRQRALSKNRSTTSNADQP